MAYPRAARVTVDGRDQALADGAVIGRRPDADVRVDHGLVSRSHAVVRNTDTGWVLEDLGSSNGTYLHGARVERIDLGSGDTIVRLGDPDTGPELTFHLPPLSPPDGAAAGDEETTRSGVGDTGTSTAAPGADDLAPAAPRPTGSGAIGPPAITVTADVPTADMPGAPGPSGAFPLAYSPAAGTVRLGRAADNDIVVDDLLVSRRHAEVTFGADGAAVLTDLGTHNGTFVNGRRVDRATLREGDVIGIGHHQFRLTAGVLAAGDRHRRGLVRGVRPVGDAA